MKTISRILIASLLIIASYASNAQGINFQGVARSANGTILASSNISLRLSILSKSVDATAEYVETKKVVTNAQGIFSIVIGDGVTATVGTFSSVNWANAPKFLKVEMDPSGGTSYINMGITQLQYVPYSFYSLGVAADNVTGVLSVAKGGTGVGSLDELKTALKITTVDTTSLSKRIDSKMNYLDTASLSNRIDAKLTKTDTSNLSNRINGINTILSEDTLYNIKLGKNITTNVPAGYWNIGIGGSNLMNNTSGDRNIAIGAYALSSNTAGKYNIAIGSEALLYNTTGTSNNALGLKSIQQNTTGNNNSAFGFYSLSSNKTGSNNTSIGYNSMNLNSTGNNNTSLGYQSLLNNTIASNNTAIGHNSLNANTEGYSNTAIGAYSLILNTTGRRNTAVGDSAMYNNTTARNNTAVGGHSLFSNTTGLYNTAVGFESIWHNTSGSNNTGVGNYALNSLVTGNSNAAVGFNALANDTSGSNNIAIGNLAGNYLNSGDGNVFIGNNAGNNQNFTNTSNKLVIQNDTSVAPLIYGEFDNKIININGDLYVNNNKVVGNQNTIDALNNRIDSLVQIIKVITTPTIDLSQAINNATPLSGAIKGTMISGRTYTVSGDIFVNTGDTLIIQPGVTMNFLGTGGVPVGIGVKGTLLSLGTSSAPIYLTYPGVTRTDQLGANPDLDPALKGKWTGIIGATTCPLIVLKWTHIDFGGAAISSAMKSFTGGSSPYPLYFANPDGSFILEDSWIYGSVDDPFRINGGKIHIMRNTFEKCGYTGGEAMNAKAGTIGDFAYNLCIGVATNGPKVSNINVPVGKPASNVRIYNNTMINCGYRRSAAGRGGSINFEEGAGGMAYNNLIVNCKFGLRVVAMPIADTANLRYGFNYYYADSISVASQFIPSLSVSTAISKPMETDIPRPSTYLPTGWTLGSVYTAPASIVSANNPRFINAPVPLPSGLMLRDIAVVGTSNYALSANSPCVGAGYIGFSPRADVILDTRYGATEITAPGIDIGCYQRNGRGNQH